MYDIPKCPHCDEYAPYFFCTRSEFLDHVGKCYLMANALVNAFGESLRRRGFRFQAEYVCEHNAWRMTVSRDDYYLCNMMDEISAEFLRHFAQEIEHAFRDRPRLQMYNRSAERTPVRFPEVQARSSPRGSIPLVNRHPMTASEIRDRRSEFANSAARAYSRDVQNYVEANFVGDGPGLKSWMRIKDDWTDMADFQARCHNHGFKGSSAEHPRLQHRDTIRTFMSDMEQDDDKPKKLSKTRRVDNGYSGDGSTVSNGDFSTGINQWTEMARQLWPEDSSTGSVSNLPAVIDPDAV